MICHTKLIKNREMAEVPEKSRDRAPDGHIPYPIGPLSRNSQRGTNSFNFHMYCRVGTLIASSCIKPADKIREDVTKRFFSLCSNVKTPNMPRMHKAHQRELLVWLCTLVSQNPIETAGQTVDGLFIVVS